MKQWEVIGPPECPIMYRRTLVARKHWKLLWHRFVPGGKDRDPHDHPRAFVTLVLRGGYEDHAPDGTVDQLGPGSVRYRPATHTHTTVAWPRGATTLVLMGPLVREWGFVRDGKWWPVAVYDGLFGHGFRCPD